jgi:PleD family two-component response regulator
VLGEYTIDTGKQATRVLVKASIGAVQWDGLESGVELLARADQYLYQGKERKKV